MPAFDTILASAINPGAGPSPALVAPSGDSLSVRSFVAPNQAWLELVTRMGTTAGFAQVRSPLFHDNVRGIRITPAESPSVFGIPGVAAQQLYPQDNLIAELSGGAAETDIMALHTYYDNLPGGQARLHTWDDILPLIKSIKPISVAVTSSATVGAWVDTPITQTEDLTHANTDYAVLGYMTNVNYGVIGVKGIDTANLRACGPGSTQELPTTNYFAYLSQQRGKPFIPVFNSANKNGTSVCVAAATASVAGIVELICAELTQNLPS